jgi:hypothetical protein
MQGRILKRMGVQRGVLDFHLAVALNGKHGLWMELKTEKGKLTKEQIDFMERKNKRGYLALAVFGFEEAVNEITNYLNFIDSKELILIQNISIK